MTVQFGVHIGPQNVPMQDLRQLWRWLDDAGVDWISVWDHLYEAPPAGGTQPHFEAVATLGALAADTTNARLGCLVFCASYRNIGLLAKSVTTIDHIANGRFEIGLGSGWHDDEAIAYGLDFPAQRDRFDILREQLAAIQGWRRGERLSAAGSHVRLDDASLLPGPIGDLPIWIGGVGKNVTLRLAGASADGWNAAYVGADQFRELSHVLDVWCETAGREPADVQRSVNLMFNLTDADPGAAQHRIEAQWADRADRVKNGSLIGRPADVMDQIAPYVEAGAGLVNVVIRPPWHPELLDEYIRDVVPAMRSQWAEPSVEPPSAPAADDSAATTVDVSS